MTQKPTALFIYGMPGAGKSTVLSTAEQYGIPSITFGDVVRKRARQDLGQNADGSDIGQWATEEREKHGDHIMALYTKEELIQHHSDADVVIIEGTRSFDEIMQFTGDFNIRTLYIEAPFEDRLERLQTRGRDGEDTADAEYLKTRDEREQTWGLDELITSDTPDYHIVNDETLEEFKNNITTVLDELTGTHQ